MQKSANLILAIVIAFTLALFPCIAFAAADDTLSSSASVEAAGESTASSEPADAVAASAVSSASAAAAASAAVTVAEDAKADAEKQDGKEAEGVVTQCSTAVTSEVEGASSAAAAKVESVEVRKEKAAAHEVAKVSKLLSYDPAAIEAIGCQQKSGHTICCPSYACAYADAVLDGTVRDHAYYCCSCCTWPDWGGGGSSFRCVGSDEQLLREAYDQIAAGKPTVVHVSWSGGEHWIALIGYENATDPDHLTLANFIALDPIDGAQINAASKYALFGDGCEHVSSR